MEMLMSFYLDEDFRSEYLEIPAQVQSEEYYVNMMIAWFFATIQKARESYRSTDEQKQILKELKR